MLLLWPIDWILYMMWHTFSIPVYYIILYSILLYCSLSHALPRPLFYSTKVGKLWGPVLAHRSHLPKDAPTHLRPGIFFSSGWPFRTDLLGGHPQSCVTPHSRSAETCFVGTCFRRKLDVLKLILRNVFNVLFGKCVLRVDGTPFSWPS